MKKILLIAWHEYTKHALRRRFLGALLAPLIVLVITIVISYVTMTAMNRVETGRVGYIDAANALPESVMAAPGEVSFQRFTDEAQARQALADEKILAYYVVAPDFASSGKADLFYWRSEPASAVREAFEDRAKHALLKDVAPATATRVINGSDFTYETADGSRKFGENNVASFLMPIVMGVIFLIALLSGSQYLMQAIVDEKENRTMEVVITSVTPAQLMSGKVLGLGALGLTQVLVWLLATVVTLLILAPRLPFLGETQIEPAFILVALVMFVLDYLVFGAIMVAIGSTVVDVKQAQSLSAPFTLLAIAPEFFIPVLLFDPNGTIAVILSVFPLTAPLAMMMRYGLVAIPLWQIGLSLLLMALAALGAFWLAGRIFRAGMLRFGQRLSLSEIAASVKI